MVNKGTSTEEAVGAKALWRENMFFSGDSEYLFTNTCVPARIGDSDK